MRKPGPVLGLLAILGGCGDGGNATRITPTATSSPTPTPAPAPTVAAACTLRDRQDWIGRQMREWYLFPETLPVSLDPTGYSTADAYLDALTASARRQERDRFFTYLTSIAQEDAYYQSGSTEGYGFRLTSDNSARVWVSEAFEGGAALAAGIDRGTEILGIGVTSGTLRDVSAIIAAEGTGGVIDALATPTAGIVRWLRVVDASGTRTLPLTMADYTLTPVSSRYGAKIIDDGGRKIGYVNLRTFIDPADPALRAAFADFRAQGVTELIVDLRYNGGGLVAIAALFGNLLGRDRMTSEVFSHIVFRPEKASEENTTLAFSPQSQSIAPTKIAFIGTTGTASASEMLINGMRPYLGAQTALVGTNTYGKPVGQIAIDRPACDDRLRVVAFSVQNSLRQGDYYRGLASSMPATCQATDDIAFPLGDPRESAVARALDFLAGRSCTPIGSSTLTAQAQRAGAPRQRTLLIPDRPTTAQREVPGLN